MSSCTGEVQDLGHAGCDPFAARAVACPQVVCCPPLYSFNSLFLHREEEGGKLLAANLKVHEDVYNSSLSLTEGCFVQSWQMLLTLLWTS